MLKGLAVFVALVFAATFLVLPRNGGGWFWEAGNGLGFLAFAGLLFQMIPLPEGAPAGGMSFSAMVCWARASSTRSGS